MSRKRSPSVERELRLHELDRNMRKNSITARLMEKQLIEIEDRLNLMNELLETSSKNEGVWSTSETEDRQFEFEFYFEQAAELEKTISQIYQENRDLQEIYTKVIEELNQLCREEIIGSGKEKLQSMRDGLSKKASSIKGENKELKLSLEKLRSKSFLEKSFESLSEASPSDNGSIELIDMYNEELKKMAEKLLKKKEAINTLSDHVATIKENVEKEKKAREKEKR